MDQPDISDSAIGSLRSGMPLPPKTLIGFSLAVVAVVIIALLSYQSLQATTNSARNLAQSVEVFSRLQALLSTLKDAETGQRGYLLTGEETYLPPYTEAKDALPGEFKSTRAMLRDRPEQLRQLDILESLANLKMAELESTIAARRAGHPDAALAVTRTDRGKILMDRIRATVNDMIAAERQWIERRGQESETAATISLAVSWGGSGVLLFLIAGAAVVAARDFRARQAQAWIRSGQMGLSAQMQGDQSLDKLGDNLLGFLAGFVDAQVGAVYMAEAGYYRRFAGYALPADSPVETIRLGDGLVGQAARDNRPLRVRDVPAGYLPISSGIGQGTPNELVIVPAGIDGVVHAVLELGFFGSTDPEQRELLSRVSETIAVTVRAAKDRQRLEELLQETQQQAEELQSGQEELRVSNEELEEQGRALSARSDDLQRANEYKSEFLANMSHELRTPLNSTLILAKLLADNKDGNLTETQVKYAQTIASAGNDLLRLINDVLDLSRIEAGKVELAPERVSISSVVESLAKTFQPTAEQGGLRFSSDIDRDAPEQIETDPQRLGQILKNLLSNAFKFTEKGAVTLRVFSQESGTVSFAVRDTGVGIAPHQQDVIFEAFRQADGSIHRKFGGTGLGLSISRDLAALLGGAITVQSEMGTGSVFTLTIPVAFIADAAPDNEPRPRAPRGVRAPMESEPEKLAAPVTEDDRDSITPGGRTILLVEDDAAFAMILRDLVREMGFQCIATSSADDGLAAAARFLPSAIILDVNLPDHSGLGVLDRLKHDARTRHIPVHIVSGSDYKREALELGAIGYALKPVKREELIEALRRMEAKFSQSVRRVLVVEDDARQRESIRHLLSNGDVQITAVASAGDALAHLKATTFDCMVVDLNLPDYSGYDLLEKMSQQEDVAFPPVIIYTGRVLSREEEQRLRRYSKSIIIKDARSPERLLDEVTLFLHQVESKLPPEHQQMLKTARHRESMLEGRRILVVEDDVRNVFALSSVLEPNGVTVLIARNGREALDVLTRSWQEPSGRIDLVLMDIMMPEMDGLTAMREIRKRDEWKNLPIIALTAKAMADDHDRSLAAGANDYIPKPLDVEKLLSLVRVWMPK
jgi:CheY-like chemotaxis protein/signal transduction histidine kinase/CHASE3 domain sensor protein